jgi:hypothetical protein
MGSFPVGTFGVLRSPPMLRVSRLTLLVSLMVAGPALAADRSEHEVMAAYLYNFAKFVQWPPPSSEQPVDICVLGVSPFGGELDRALDGKQVNGRPLSARLARNLDEASRCEIVFIASSERGRLDEVLAHFSGRPVLTVSDISTFAERGGMIGLRMDNKRVRFDVNMQAARGADLKLSSQLLKVAKQVIGYTDGAQ